MLKASFAGSWLFLYLNLFPDAILLKLTTNEWFLYGLLVDSVKPITPITARILT